MRSGALPHGKKVWAWPLCLTGGKVGLGRKVQPGARWLVNLLIAGNVRHAHQGGENIGFGFGFMGVFFV